MYTCIYVYIEVYTHTFKTRTFTHFVTSPIFLSPRLTAFSSVWSPSPPLTDMHKCHARTARTYSPYTRAGLHSCACYPLSPRRTRAHTHPPIAQSPNQRTWAFDASHFDPNFADRFTLGHQAECKTRALLDVVFPRVSFTPRNHRRLPLRIWQFLVSC